MYFLSPKFHTSFLLSLGLVLAACSSEARYQSRSVPHIEKNTQMSLTLDTATFGAGCFWCVEAVFDQVEGVHSVTSGYSGGHVPDPSYKAVCTGETGHAEVVQITYDPLVISYPDLLEAFFSSHDPTTLNRQGNDVGTQYRSIILCHTEEQRALAVKFVKALGASGKFKDPIVTEIVSFKEFYPAEAYHQDYYENNRTQPYCQFVIRPKLDKFTKEFKAKLKK